MVSKDRKAEAAFYGKVLMEIAMCEIDPLHAILIMNEEQEALKTSWGLKSNAWWTAEDLIKRQNAKAGRGHVL